MLQKAKELLEQAAKETPAGNKSKEDGCSASCKSNTAIGYALVGILEILTQMHAKPEAVKAPPVAPVKTAPKKVAKKK